MPRSYHLWRHGRFLLRIFAEAVPPPWLSPFGIAVFCSMDSTDLPNGRWFNHPYIWQSFTNLMGYNDDIVGYVINIMCMYAYIYISECPKVPRASPRTSWFVELTELAGPNGQWKMDVTDKWIGFPGLYQPNIDMFCTCSLSETTVPKPEECYVLLNGLILGYRFGNALPS